MPKKQYEDPEYAEAPADDQAGDETAADQADAGAQTIADVDEAVVAAQKERDAYKEQFLRAVADFDNYRKRIERERRELSEYAAADVLLELLPIIDNFERALSASAPGAMATTADRPAESEAFYRGVELIHKQMLDLLRKRGVTRIEALGADFDPNVHQAVIHEPSEEHREGEVMQELQHGYKLGDRLLRPSMVKVAKRA